MDVQDCMLDALTANYNAEQLMAQGKPVTLYTPIAYALEAGGKRIRPRLALISASLYTSDTTPVIPVAVALETFHNFTLLHDDIMDNSPLRRGRATVFAKYGVAQAILSGDAMYTLALTELAKAPSEKLPFLLKVFSEMTLGIMEGQQWDMDFETTNDVSIEKYFEMISLKTAVLFATALQMGAYCAGACEEDCQKLYQSGMAMGIAFQLRDDYLDVYGSNNSFGKPIGGDIRENKKTWLSLRAAELARINNDCEYSVALALENDEGKVNAVRNFYNKCGLPEESECLIEQYTSSALNELDALRNVDPVALDELKELYRGLAGRKV